MSAPKNLGSSLLKALKKIFNRASEEFAKAAPQNPADGQRFFHKGREWIWDGQWQRVYDCDKCQDQYFFRWENEPGRNYAVYGGPLVACMWCAGGEARSFLLKRDGKGRATKERIPCKNIFNVSEKQASAIFSRVLDSSFRFTITEGLDMARIREPDDDSKNGEDAFSGLGYTPKKGEAPF